MTTIRDSDLRRVWHPFQQAEIYRDRQLIAQRAERCYIYDDAGRKYLDGISGLWNVNLGYSEPRIIDAIRKQLERMPFTSLIVFSHEPSIRLAESIAALTPGDLAACFFTSGGSEATDTALKLSRHVQILRGQSLRHKVISLNGAYHGMSYGALSVTGMPDDRWQFPVELGGAVQIPSAYTDLQASMSTASARSLADSLELALAMHDPRTIAAVIVEPIMGVAGMIRQDVNDMRRIREITSQNGILFIVDEVASGFGRTGSWFAIDRAGVVPDMLLLAKGITGGYAPLGAVVVRDDLFKSCQIASEGAGFMHGFTYGGSPAPCAASLAVIEAIQSDNLLSKVEEDGRQLLELLRDGTSGLPNVGEVRGTGLMISFDLIDPSRGRFASPKAGARLVANCRERGVIIRTTYGGATINLAPPFICNEQELEQLASTVVKALVSDARTA